MTHSRFHSDDRGGSQLQSFYYKQTCVNVSHKKDEHWTNTYLQKNSSIPPLISYSLSFGPISALWLYSLHPNIHLIFFISQCQIQVNVQRRQHLQGLTDRFCRPCPTRSWLHQRAVSNFYMHSGHQDDVWNWQHDHRQGPRTAKVRALEDPGGWYTSYLVH